MYYLQKMEEQAPKEKPYVSTLSQARSLLAIYGRNKNLNHNRQITLLDSILPFLKSLPGFVANKQVPINTCVNGMTILNAGAQLYLVRSDSVMVSQMLNVAKELWKAMEKDPYENTGKMLQCHLLLYAAERAYAQVQMNINEEGKLLNRTLKLIEYEGSELNPLWKRAFESATLMKLIDYHIKQRHIDSSNYYFNSLKQKVTSYGEHESGDGTRFLLYEGEIDALNGNYKTAYQKALKAYERNDSIIAVKIADIDNNMYAHLVAEQNRLDLARSEVSKSQRTYAMTIIVGVLVAAVIAFTFRLKQRDRRAKHQIEELGRATRLEIESLQANADMIQRRMSMELHDGLAGMLVGISQQLDLEVMSELDEARSERLKKIADLAKEVYREARLKSHDWHRQGVLEEFRSFSQSVNRIIGQALSKEQYDIQIEIDNFCLENTTLDIRVHLLRIIQEAVTNVMKHAKASVFKLFLYEDEGFITLNISDNGKGFISESRRTGGLGQQALKTRVIEMCGSLEIKSSAEGTELLIHIPF